MTKLTYPADAVVRDGIETLAEPVDIAKAAAMPPEDEGSDPDLDEALRETFPASDPIASGRTQ